MHKKRLICLNNCLKWSCCYKKAASLFVLHKKCLTFVIAKATGTLDEWLSQRSAKPCTAVRIRQVPQRRVHCWALFFVSTLSVGFYMADNFLEKRMEQYRARSGGAVAKGKDGLAALLLKNRSVRGYQSSYIVREDQLRRIVAVNSRVPSARNRQPLRFRLVLCDEAAKVLPLVRMGTGLADVELPLKGTEPNAFIVVCSTIEPRNSTYVDLGISVQSMLLQAVEMGLNGLCMMAFDKEALTEVLGLPCEPLVVLAIGKGCETVKIVDIAADGDRGYYRKEGVHYVPKVVAEDLIIK